MKKKKDQLQKAREFFENIIKIHGENQLYRALYGELPVDKDTETRMRKMRDNYLDAKPILKEIEKHIQEAK